MIKLVDSSGFVYGHTKIPPATTKGWVDTGLHPLPSCPDGKVPQWNGSEWVVVDIPTPPEPTAEEQAEKVRAERDRLLLASDWTQLVDSPLSAEQKEAWAVYRQALRDVTDQVGFPGVVEWPKCP
jgi:hypothetical protein